VLGGRTVVGSNLFSRGRLVRGWSALGRERSEGGGGERFAGETVGTDSEVMVRESSDGKNEGAEKFFAVTLPIPLSHKKVHSKHFLIWQTRSFDFDGNVCVTASFADFGQSGTSPPLKFHLDHFLVISQSWQTVLF